LQVAPDPLRGAERAAVAGLSVGRPVRTTRSGSWPVPLRALPWHSAAERTGVTRRLPSV